MRNKRLTAWTLYGGLGPDLDNPECQIKRITRLRVADFSNQLREINKTSCKQRPELPKSFPEPAQQSSRLAAIEYARTLPKFRKRPPPQILQQNTQAKPNYSHILKNLLLEHEKLDSRVAAIHRRYNYSSGTLCFLFKLVSIQSLT
jgi:hypothetical protein